MKFEKYREYLSDKRYRRMVNVLNERTKYFTFVFENFYDSRNVCAALRSIEGLGYQDVHLIVGKNKFKINGAITQGSEKWLSIHKYNSLNKCFDFLKSSGYKIFTGEPDEKYPSISELNLDTRCAFLFGQEGFGVSKDALEEADGIFHLPINGFIQSFNVSVTVAITAYALREFLESNIPEDKWSLSQTEKEDVMSEWLKKNETIKYVMEKEKNVEKNI